MSNTDKYTYLVGERDENGTFWCHYETPIESDAKACFRNYSKNYPNKHLELVQQITMNKVVDTHYPEVPPVVLKEHFWQIEGEDRDPNYPAWTCPNNDDQDKYLSVTQAIGDAKKLAKNEGKSYKRFRVVEVEIHTTIKEVATFNTEEN